MNILQVNYSDLGGGAEKSTLSLHLEYLSRGLDAHLAVGFPQTQSSNTLVIPNDDYRSRWAQFWLKTSQKYSQKYLGVPALSKIISKVKWVGQPIRLLNNYLGLEDYSYPASRSLLELIPKKIDILHCHNLHGEYFDLRGLPQLSRRVPVVVTLRDDWLLTGHCAAPFDCNRWEIGCGKCPDLTIYPAIRRDATAYNWRRKESIYRRSLLYTVTPSRWLAEKLERSMLRPIKHAIIPNGVNQSIFKPADHRRARLILGIPTDTRVALFVAQFGKENPFKDYHTIDNAIRLSKNPGLMFFSLGGRPERLVLDGKTVWETGFIGDPEQVALYYQACDVYLHAAKSDNFPLTILEALSCGTPVIATALGGIPEQIQDGLTGFLVPPGDAESMAAKLDRLMANTELRLAMSRQAIIEAQARFDIRKTADRYLNYYNEVIEDRKIRSGSRAG